MIIAEATMTSTPVRSVTALLSVAAVGLLREDMSDTEYMFGVVELPPYSNDNIIRHKYSDVECTDSEFQSSKEDDSCEISSIENEEFSVVEKSDDDIPRLLMTKIPPSKII
uniref:Uncharacterized protein n=1 Tax=Timema shepardi TaxID=629360 RepID=A0A7R9B133_TIMSH|nr:unnamed protein product [Timema shepardi]